MFNVQSPLFMTAFLVLSLQVVHFGRQNAARADFPIDLHGEKTCL